MFLQHFSAKLGVVTGLTASAFPALVYATGTRPIQRSACLPHARPLDEAEGSRNGDANGSFSERRVTCQEARMSRKPTRDNDAGDHSPETRAEPIQSVYGDRWGPGATPTPHNQPGSIARDPASAPPPAEQREGSASAASDANTPPEDDEAALRETREQSWDSEGGATSTRSGRG
jgi:hypothetical protein